MDVSLAIGIIFLAGAAGGKIARTVKLPSVTGNLFAGILIGPSILGLVHGNVLAELGPINDLALGVIALSIGAELHWSKMKKLAGDVAKVFCGSIYYFRCCVFILIPVRCTVSVCYDFWCDQYSHGTGRNNCMYS